MLPETIRHMTGLLKICLLGRRSFLIAKHQRRASLRSFSSQPDNIRGTIPYLGYGVAVGQHAEVERRFSAQQTEQFGDLVQDKNILHFPPKNWDDAVTEMPHLQAVKDSGLIQFNEEIPHEDDSSKNSDTTMKPLVHGIFVSSLFSSIFGSLSPGCVYMNQTLNFANPVFAEELVLARIEIEKIRKWRRGGVVLQCNTTVSVGYDDKTGTFTKDAVTGLANVWLPSGYQVSTGGTKQN